MFVTYLFHSYLMNTYSVHIMLNACIAFETGIADTELSTYIALN